VKQQTDQPLHGGDILSASKRYGVPVEQWIDLSTGINPQSYPVDGLNEAAFKQLPYIQPAFYAAAKRYYGVNDILAVSGSQAVIQALPQLLQDKPLLAPKVGYQEYIKHWLKAGRKVVSYESFEQADARESITASLMANADQHLLLINPNNPTGLRFSAEDIAHWAALLADGCYLIVDEAFADINPEKSALRKDLPSNVMVLRSFGKFFGLAGIRLGYVVANSVILAQLNARLGLWQINGPAQALAIAALNDVSWQAHAREEIELNSIRCQQLFLPLMQEIEVFNETHQGLFSAYLMLKKQAEDIFDSFARVGILLRVIDVSDKQAVLRIGIIDRQSEKQISRVIQTVELFCSKRLTLVNEA
jgi:cobalamin biosynthetic protein CobC